MVKNQSTYTLKIDAELGDLQKTLNTAKASLSSFMASGNAPKGLEQAFEKINSLLGQLSDKASKPLDLKGLNKAGKDLNNVRETIHSVVRLLGDFNDLSDDAKISFLPPDEQKKIKDTVAALKKYEQAVVNITKKTKELDAARNTANKKGVAVSKAKSNVDSLTGSRAIKQARLEGERGKLAAINVEGGNPEKIARYEASIKSMQAEIADLDRQIQEANNTLEQSQSEYDAAAKSVTQLESEVKRANKGALTELKDQAKAVGVSLDGLNGRSAAAQMEILTKRLEAFNQEAIQGSKPAFDAIVAGCDNAKDSAKQVSEIIDQTTESAKRFEEINSQRKAFEDKTKQFLGLAGAAKVLKSSLRDAFATITELDAIMTEMAVVTDLTVGDYWDQLPQYSKRASELGVSIGSAYEAATLYYQQGLKTNEVTAISAETLKLAKIANISAADATDKMTAALRGFNMELNETSAQKIADVYSELAAITAADVDQISTAMTKTASIASSAGMEFETTAAFLSQIIETTRESAETAGTAMKTVIARFQELKKDPSEIGEVDGEIVDANKIETALRSVGVSLRDTQGQFRELDDVFMELSSKWDGLDKNTQRYIATIAAGSRQQSRFIAMMQNYGRTQELVTAANNSAGASQKQFEKTMESLSAKMEKLKNAWHEFTMGIMNSDLVKIGIDIATKLLEIINKATSAFDGLAGSVVKVSSVLAIFKVGKSLFAMIPKRFKEAMIDVIRQAIQGGEDAAEGAAKGATRKAAEIKAQGGVNQTSTGPEKQKISAGQWIQDKSGFSDLKEGFKKGRKRKDATEAAMALSKAEGKTDKILGKDNINEKKLDKALDKQKKAQEEYDEALNRTAEDEARIKQEQIEGWNQITAGIGKAAQSAVALGVAMSAVGGFFSSIGLEGVGEVLTGIGNTLTMVGSGAMALIPIIKMIGGSLVKAGVSGSAAFWWVTLIMVAIVGVIALIATAIKSIRDASPEKKLKDAEEATQRAEEAADHAKEAYEGLAGALDSLGDKYKNLETLTRGTKEWTQAMLEINEEVLNLTEKYPELMKYVKSQEGVLTLDLESADVQNVLKQKQSAALAAQNNVLVMKQRRSEAQADVTYSKLTASATAGSDNPQSGDSATDAKIKAQTKANTEALAKAIASGEIVGNKEGILKELQNMGLYGYSDSLSDTAKQNANYYLEAMAEQLAENVEDLRKFGDELNANEQQMKILNDTAAANARAMVNTENFTEKEVKRMAQIMDGEVYDAIKDGATAEFNKEYDAMSSGEKEAERERIIKQQYGENAKIDDDGNVTVNGNQVATGLTEEDIKTLGIEQKASAAAQKAAEASIATFNDITGVAVKKFGDGAAEAIDAMYQQDAGGALTQAQLDELAKVDVAAIWEGLDEATQGHFGNSYEAFLEEFDTAKTEAAAAFAQAGDVVAGYMTADMAKGYAEKLGEVAAMAGGEVAKQSIIDATQELVSGLDSGVQQEIQSRINMTDWTNMEDLLALQIDLQQQYGLDATKYIQTLEAASFATSKLATTVQVFGDLWKATEKLNQSMTKLSELQWEYDRALKNGDDVSGIVGDMLGVYAKQASLHQTAYNESNNDIAKIYGQGKNNYGIDLTDFVTLGATGIDVDNSRLQDAIDSGKVKEEDANEWIEKLTKQYATSQEHLQGLRDTLANIEELEQEGKDAYTELRDMAKEAILDSLQKQIDLQQDTLDATKDANAQLVNTLQNQINEDRQARENEKQEENIANLQSRAAYLGMDTSGANTMGVLDLDKQIAEAEQQYEDTLIDQSIQQLQDANDAAAEQRERQISLAQQQLDAYAASAQFQDDVETQLADMLKNQEDWQSTSLGELLAETFTVDMSALEQEDWINKIGGSVGLANAWSSSSWSTTKNEIITAINGIKKEEENLPNTLTASGEAKATEAKRTELASKGFTALTTKGTDGNYTVAVGKDGKTDENEIKAIEELLKEDAESTTLASDRDRLTKAKAAGAYNGAIYENATAYYKENYQGNAKETKSYSDYLAEQSASVGMFGDEKRQAIIDAYEVPSDYMAVEGRTKYSWGEEWNFNEGLFSTVTAVDGRNNMKKVVMTNKGSSLTLHGETFAAADYPNKFLYDGTHLFATMDDSWWQGQGSTAGTKKQNADYQTLINAITNNTKKKYTAPKFKTGGLADFTGPAWLDGTPTKPEYILNAAQTERFFSLVDVLEGFNNGNDKKPTGDNYFDISINVEKLDSDYDVEQLANKIRSMIYDDATYRNVNAISHKR